MRILVGHQRAYAVERICPTARDGKRTLREHMVSEMYIDHLLDGNENGSDILNWAIENRVIPQKVILVCNRVHLRADMGRLLSDNGFKTADGINFLKH